MIKILYYSNCEKMGLRTFSFLKDLDGFDQTICACNSIKIGRLNNKCINVHSDNDLINVIKRNRPDVLVVVDKFEKIEKVKKLGSKIVFAAHGEVVMGKMMGPYWNQFDLVCLGRAQTKGLFNDGIKKIVTNALIQYDTLFNAMELNKKEQGRRKAITIFGPKIKNSELRTPYAKLFYESIKILIEICKKYDWNLVIRPKHKNYDVMFGNICPKNDFLRIKDLKDSRISVVEDDRNPYECFLSDVLISVSPRSTVEIESALLNKPLIKICSKNILSKMFDAHNVYGTHSLGAAIFVEDINSDLENVAFQTMNFENIDLKNNQNKFVKYLGITFDGKAHERMIGAIREIL